MHESVKETLRQIWTKAGPVDTDSLSDRELRRIEQETQATVGSPVGLGYFGLAVGTMVLAFVTSGIMPADSIVAAIPAVLIFAGIAQFVAALYSFTRGIAFTGTLFGAYGAGYALLATFIWMQAAHLIPISQPANFLAGIGWLCFGYISLVLGFAALKLNPTYLLIAWALVPGYVLPGITAMGGFSPAVGHVGGYCLFIASLGAFYAGAVIVINSTHQDNVLSLGRFSDRA